MKKIRGDTRKIANKIVSPSSAQKQANNMLKRLEINIFVFYLP